MPHLDLTNLTSLRLSQSFSGNLIVASSPLYSSLPVPQQHRPCAPRSGSPVLRVYGASNLRPCHAVRCHCLHHPSPGSCGGPPRPPVPPALAAPSAASTPKCQIRGVDEAIQSKSRTRAYVRLNARSRRRHLRDRAQARFLYVRLTTILTLSS